MAAVAEAAAAGDLSSGRTPEADDFARRLVVGKPRPALEVREDRKKDEASAVVKYLESCLRGDINAVDDGFEQQRLRAAQLSDSADAQHRHERAAAAAHLGPRVRA